MEHPPSTCETVGQIVALRRVLGSLEDRVERRRLSRVVRQLRRQLGVGVPKHRAAACIGVSAQALDHWVGEGRIPVVRRPGSSRQLIERDALLAIAAEVERLREDGGKRTLAKALANLSAGGQTSRRFRPNQSARELRYEYLRTTPAARLRAGIELSELADTLAKGARMRKLTRAVT